MSEKVAIKKSTLEAIGEAVRGKDGSTDLIPVNALADRITALPTASGENKLNQLFNGTIKEVTAEDLQEVTEIQDNLFGYCNALERVEIPAHIQNIGSGTFKLMNQLTAPILDIYYSSVIPTLDSNLYAGRNVNLHFPSKSAFDDYIVQFQTFTNSGPHQNAILNTLFINNEVVTELTIPETLTKLLTNTIFKFNSKQLYSITFLGDITQIKGYPFGYEIEQELLIDFTHCTVVPSIQYATKVFAQGYIIKVPAALYDEWISTTNWANYAEYIVAV